MSKTFTNIILYTLSICVLFTLTMFFWPSGENKIYPGGKDTYDSFGDGRFVMSRGEVMTLFDNQHYFNSELVSKTIIFEVDKYIEIDPYVYINGYYSYGSVDENNSVFSANDINSDEFIKFTGISNVPYYTKLNYRTGEADFYTITEFNEIPESDKVIFEKEASFWCEFLFWRTCYQN